MRKRQTYFLEQEGDSFGSFFCAQKVLYDNYSQYQRITVFDTDEVGRVLKLDEVFNVSTVMEAFYHEPMAHIPIGMLKEPTDVLIIGGGDFGIARHVLKHPFIKKTTICEIDEEVINVSREFFPEWAQVEKDSRFELIIADGYKYLDSLPPCSFDIIIIDSTDAFEDGHASVLTSKKFYDLTHDSLKKDGLAVQIIADTIFYKDFWNKVLVNVQKVYKKIAPFFVPIPFYVTGPWGLLLLGKGDVELNPTHISESFLESIPGLKTMTRDNIIGWFSLPPHIKEFMQID